MDVKMNLRIITKYRAADPEILSITKSILNPYGYATVIPPACELKSHKVLIPLKVSDKQILFAVSYII